MHFLYTFFEIFLHPVFHVMVDKKKVTSWARVLLHVQKKKRVVLVFHVRYKSSHIHPLDQCILLAYGAFDSPHVYSSLFYFIFMVKL